jgi:hypothetical protein
MTRSSSVDVQREVAKRGRILADFNKTEADFKSLKEYNDYLEEVEEIVFNALEGRDAEETAARISRYRQENADLIRRNRQRQHEEYMRLQQHILAEEEAHHSRWRDTLDALDRQKHEATNEDRDLIDVLTTSNRSGAELVKAHHQARAMREQKRAKETVVKSAPATFAATVPPEELVPYVYQPPHRETFGPSPPSVAIVAADLDGYQGLYTPRDYDMIFASAGGFSTAHMAIHALADAYDSLYLL